MTDLDALTATVERLRAQADIARLLHEHFHAVDEGDHDRQADLFARARVRYLQGDVVLLETTDRAAFHAAISTARIYGDGTPRTHHVISGLVVDVDPSLQSARSRCCSTVLQATDELPLQAIACGVFEDEYLRDDTGAWHFHDRVGRMRLSGDTGHHVPSTTDIGDRLRP